MGLLSVIAVSLLVVGLVSHTHSAMRPGVNENLAVVVETQNLGAARESQTVGINWNKAVDLIIDAAKAEIIKQNKDEIDLPDIREEFSDKVMLIKVKGEFNASKGRLNSLATLRRTGDVHVTRHGAALTISCTLGLGTVHLRYEHYRAKVNHVPGISGYIKGDVAGNSLRITATIEVNGGKCVAILNEVKVVELEGMKIKISGSGFGPLNWLITKVSNSYVKNHKADIISKIEMGLFGEISKSIKDFHCEKYVALIML